MRVVESPYKGKTGVVRICSALRISLHGLRAAWTHEDAFRQELALTAVLIPLAFLSGASATQKALMIMTVMFVLVVELVNSAIEAVTDRVSLEEHALAKRAKDLGSAAVLLSIVTAAMTWSIVLYSVA
jgi:diacylglycerol kinase (ATP)